MLCLSVSSFSFNYMLGLSIIKISLVILLWTIQFVDKLQSCINGRVYLYI